MTVEGRKRRVPETEEVDEEAGGSQIGENPSEEDVEEGEHEGQKTKQDQTPLWKYVQRPEAGRGGGTTKFHCPHCNSDFTGSYTRLRRHLCGKRAWDGEKQIGIRTCDKVSTADRAKYIKEEEDAQYKAKRSRGFFESSQRTPSASSQGSGYGHGGSGSSSLRRRTISDFLDEGSRNDVDSKIYRFLYANGIPFNVLRSPYWHEMVSAINDAPTGYKSPGYDKARTVGLDHEKAKISHSLNKMTSSWTDNGVSIVSDGWTNVKGKPLISVLAVSRSGPIFLAAHDYSDKFKTAINIAEALLETIERIGPYNVIQVITDNAPNCKAAGAIIEDRYPNIFWSGCLVHTLNLLLHDIVKNKNEQYQWIGDLYKKGKKMIKFITNHSNTHGLFRSHSRLELLKIARTRFGSYYLTFRRLLKVREGLASMVSSQNWQVLKERATNVADIAGFETVEEAALDGQFWTTVRQVLDFTKPIYNMIRFADTDKPVIGEVYEQMDTMLGEIKDIVNNRDPDLYNLIHDCVCERWKRLNLPLHCLAYILTPKYYSDSWLGKPAAGGGVRTKPHLDREVTKGYLDALEKLVPDREECAAVRLEIGRYFTGSGLYGNFHAMDDKDKFDSLTWWETYGGDGLLRKLALKVLAQVVNSSSAERCWSTYSYIHNVKRNRLNENRAESLVYVHYNLRLLSHYCDRANEDPTYKIWDNHPEDDNLEDGIVHMEELEDELVRDEAEAAAATMPPPPPPSSSSSRGPILVPLLSPPPSTPSRGGSSSGRRSGREPPRRPPRPAYTPPGDSRGKGQL